MLTNIEPDKNNLPEIKSKLAGKIAVCSGVNNYHVIEMGTADQVNSAVAQALDTLSNSSGFILSPSDSILDTSETARKNFYTMIESWKKYRKK
jgi:UDP-N-acetylmuramyl pentapeptide synthase